MKETAGDQSGYEKGQGRVTKIIKQQYGSKRGAFQHFTSRIQYLCGSMRHLEAVHWTGVRRLVFVCSGNICRSPYAEARARSLGFDARSFGLNAATGVPADPVACRIAASRGVDLSGHRAARLEDTPLTAADLVIAMEPAHGRALLAANQRPPWQVTLLGLWSVPARPYLADPYGLGAEYFETCFDIIDLAVDGFGQRLTENRGADAQR